MTVNRQLSFGEALRKAIKDAGRTQAWLAEELGVRGGTVTDWVQDRALPSGDYMVRLPELLNCSGHWLLTGEGPMRPDQDDAPVRLQVIGRIADGRVSPRILRALDRLHREPGGVRPDDIDPLIRELQSEAASEEAQS